MNTRFFASVCMAVISITVYAQRVTIDTIKDVAYKRVGDTALRLDIYSNIDDSTTAIPVIIYIHGGSWIHGDKGWVGSSADHRALIRAFLKNHYRVVSIDYRLADGKNVTFREELADCRDAVKWVRRNASVYFFDSGRIALWGASAGAHLCLCVAYEPLDSTEVNGVINNYGPTNLNRLFRRHLCPVAKGLARLFVPKMYATREQMLSIFPGDYCSHYSPVRIARKYSVPTLTVHGGRDRLVPVSQARQLTRCLKKRGEITETVIFPDAVHAFPRLSDEEIRLDVERTLLFCRLLFGE